MRGSPRPALSRPTAVSPLSMHPCIPSGACLMRIRHVGVQGPGKPTAGERMGTTERNKRLPSSASLRGRGVHSFGKDANSKSNWYFPRSNLDCTCRRNFALSKRYDSTWLETQFSHNIYNSMWYCHDRNTPNILPGPQLYVTGPRTQPSTHSSS